MIWKTGGLIFSFLSFLFHFLQFMGDQMFLSFYMKMHMRSHPTRWTLLRNLSANIWSWYELKWLLLRRWGFQESSWFFSWHQMHFLCCGIALDGGKNGCFLWMSVGFKYLEKMRFLFKNWKYHSWDYKKIQVQFAMSLKFYKDTDPVELLSCTNCIQ